MCDQHAIMALNAKKHRRLVVYQRQCGILRCQKIGMVHVDEALHGLISELRKTNKFEGKFLETLLIVPPTNTISAKKLMLIGLGNRNDFKPIMMRLVGLV